MICEALAKYGLANRCAPMLQRVQTVRKAATSTEPRTVHRHRETMKVVQTELVDVPKVLIVDDVVTSGATLFAAVEIARGLLSECGGSRVCPGSSCRRNIGQSESVSGTLSRRHHAAPQWQDHP